VHAELVVPPSAAALSQLLAARGLPLTPERVRKAQADEAERARLEAPELAKARRLFSAQDVWLVPVMAGDVRGLGDLTKVSRALLG
jgi:hypothetical protein